jgi:hypothetical protein
LRPVPDAHLVVARRLLDAVRELPTPAWGRDEQLAGKMWNSNSIISWLLVRSGIDPARRGCHGMTGAQAACGVCGRLKVGRFAWR